VAQAGAASTRQHVKDSNITMLISASPAASGIASTSSWQILRCLGCTHVLRARKAARQAHLQVTLWLHEAPHAAEGSDQLALRVCEQAWHDSVVGPLAGCKAVGVARVQVEAVAAVLQAEAATL
jgi:hypothetical protein